MRSMISKKIQFKNTLQVDGLKGFLSVLLDSDGSNEDGRLEDVSTDAIES